MPEVQGMDSSQLARFFEALTTRQIAINSALIVRNGNIVAEMVVASLDVTDPQNLYSVTKSVTTTAFGVAWDAGLVGDLDQPVADYFPAWQTDDYAAITLHDLLTMQSGLSWPDRNGFATLAMLAAPDWVEFVLARPIETEPGSMFLYNSGNSHLLSAIIQAETAQTMQAFVQTTVFDPLGIAPEAYRWDHDPQGITSGGWGLSMTPRDAARFAYLILHDGQWGDQQLVSPEWIELATTPYSTFDAARDYGFQWWLFSTHGYYAAAGLGGQFIIVHPALDLIAVITADLRGADDQLPRLLYEEFVIPAVIADTPLSPDPAGAAALQTAITVSEYGG